MESLTPILTDATTLRDKIHDKVTKSLNEIFPLNLKNKVLEIKDIQIDKKNYSPNDQKKALMTGTSLNEIAKGTLILKDKEGNILDTTPNFTLVHLPYLTERHTVILDGNEYQIANQIRRKPGVYTQRAENGELRTVFNTTKGRNFNLAFDDKKGTFNIEYGTSNIPLYSVLKTLGAGHEDISKALGSDLASTLRNEVKDHATVVNKFYSKIEHPAMLNENLPLEAKERIIREKLTQAGLDPNVTKYTLDHPYENVSAPALLTAAKKLVGVNKGLVDTDDTDSLTFKTFHAVDDFLAERIKLSARTWAPKAKFALSTKTNIKEALRPAPFSDGLKKFVMTSQLSSVPTGINPIELIDHSVKVTALGEGGIPNERAIPLAARLTHSTHFGAIDPIRTPECFSEDTEVFTNKGWKKWENITENDWLACRINERLEFHKPIKLIKQDYNGTMYGLLNNKISYLVTPNHRILCAPLDAIYPIIKNNAWRINYAEEVHGKPRVFDTKHDAYIGEEIEFFELPKVESLPKQLSANGGGELNDSIKNIDKINMKDWASFMGWYLAEGSLKTLPGILRGCIISQSNTINKENCQIIEALLKRLPFSWTYQESNQSFHIGGKQLASYLNQFGYCNDKFIPEYFFGTSIESRTNLLEALLLGDGRIDSIRNTGKHYKQQVFCTTSPKLAFDVERLAISLGHAVSIKIYKDKREERYLDIYEVRLLQDRFRQGVPKKDHYFIQEYTGKVYCAEVPGGLLYVKRNNSIGHWSGNSKAAGVDVRASIYAHRDDKGNLYTYMRNVKTNKLVPFKAGELIKHIVAFPNQEMKGLVDAFVNGEVKKVPASQVEFQLPNVQAQYSPATTLIPFIHNIQGNRAIMGSKMGTQALPLVEREQPYVQSKSEHPDGHSFETIYGHMVVPVSPVTGTVKKIENGFIYIKPDNDKRAFETDECFINDNGHLEINSYSTHGDPPTFSYDLPKKFHKDIKQKKEILKDGRTMITSSIQIPLEEAKKHPELTPYVEQATPKSFLQLLGFDKKANEELQHDIIFNQNEAQEHAAKHNLPIVTFHDDDELFSQALEYLNEKNTKHVLTGPGLYRYSELTKEAAKDEDLVKVPYQTYFPFPSKTFLHHDVQVKPGQTVQAGQRLGDSNFTRNGTLSLGKNLLVAYMPYNGLNSNDATVISESCSKKLTSEHMYREVYPVNSQIEFNLARHKQYYGTKYTAAQYAKLDANGIVKKGAKVDPKDLLVVGLTKTQLQGADLILGKLSKALTQPYKEVNLFWEHGTQGEIIDVVKTSTQIAILIKTFEKMNIGDKLAGRYGNKGVIAKIIPDHEMIKDEQGRPIDLIITSASVVSRINPAQIIETAVGKVVEKTGKPIVYDNSEHKNAVEWAEKLLKDHNVKDKEIVFDPVNNRKIVGPDGKGVLVGRQYIYKLFKSTDTNFSGHGVGPYDLNEQPVKVGGDESAKGIGKMELDALLAHNARNFLQEASTIRGQKNEEFWKSIQLGLPLPQAKPSFAFNKFTTMLEGTGLKVNKQGSKINLLPMTDKEIVARSVGAIQNNKTLLAKNLAPEKGGLFDPRLTGGPQGTLFSHIELHEPIPNPIFFEPIRRLLGMTEKQFDEAVRQKGGQWFKNELGKINIELKLKELNDQLKVTKGNDLNNIVKQIKYLKNLQSINKRPEEAYVISKVPVIPPVFRPIVPQPNDPSTLMISDANKLYAHVMDSNDTLKNTILDSDLGKHRALLYNSVGALFGTDEVADEELRGQKVKGFLKTIAGVGTPKGGFFQRKLMRRTQDVSGRGTIVPDPNLSMDEVGLPEEMLWKMFDKLILARLIRKGYPALVAKEMLEKRGPLAREALLEETKTRPVLLNRAPTLHRWSFVSAYAKPVQGKTIRMSPFLEKGMNADYDGDTLQIHAPVTQQGVEDAKQMTLSNLLLADHTRNKIMAFPQHEAIIGTTLATNTESNKNEVKTFKTKEEVRKAWEEGKLKLSDEVRIENE